MRINIIDIQESKLSILFQYKVESLFQEISVKKERIVDFIEANNECPREEAKQLMIKLLNNWDGKYNLSIRYLAFHHRK